MKCSRSQKIFLIILVVGCRLVAFICLIRISEAVISYLFIFLTRYKFKRTELWIVLV